MKRFLAYIITLLSCSIIWSQTVNPIQWTYTSRPGSNGETELLFTAKIEDGWHIYALCSDPNSSIPTHFSFSSSDNYVLISEVSEPKPMVEKDEFTNSVAHYHEGTISFVQRIKQLSNNEVVVKGRVEYQLCGDGRCLAPEEEEFSIKIGAEKTAIKNEVVSSKIEEKRDEKTTIEHVFVEEDTISTLDNSGENEAIIVDKQEENRREYGLWWVFLISIGAGILTMFTPCVYPMIPMTVSYFMHLGEDRRRNRQKVWVFGLSIVLLFAVIGAILTLIFGETVLYDISTAWLPNLIFFVICMVFALSFFGLFELRFPQKWTNTSDQQADKGGFLAPFFIALTTVLVSFSCTGPILGAAFMGLTHVSSERWMSIVSLLGFGIGFSFPFTLLAFFPQFVKGMKSGSWLQTVKIAFAFLELAFGMKFLQIADQVQDWHILDREVYLSIWIAIFSLLGMYLIGKLHFKGEEKDRPIGVGRLLVAIVDFAFVVYMLPGLWGAPLNGISGLIPAMETQDFVIVQSGNNGERGIEEHNTYSLPSNRKYNDQLFAPHGYEAFYDLDEAKEYAGRVGKPVLIDFTGKTCSNCREMEQYVWGDDKVKKILKEGFIICSLFTDANTIVMDSADFVTDDKGRTLTTVGKKNSFIERSIYNMNAQPYYVAIDNEGNILTQKNYSYNRNADSFIVWLEEALHNYANNHSL